MSHRPAAPATRNATGPRRFNENQPRSNRIQPCTGVAPAGNFTPALPRSYATGWLLVPFSGRCKLARGVDCASGSKIPQGAAMTWSATNAGVSGALAREQRLTLSLERELRDGQRIPGRPRAFAMAVVGAQLHADDICAID